MEFAFAGGDAGLEFSDDGEGVGGGAGGVAFDGLEGSDAVEIGLQDVGRQAMVTGVLHASSGGGTGSALFVTIKDTLRSMRYAIGKWNARRPGHRLAGVGQLDEGCKPW